MLSPATMWKLVPVALLTMSIVMGAITVSASLSGSGAGVEDEFYQDGLRWDELRQERERGELLGREVKFADGNLQVFLSGVGGKPMLDAQVDAVVFHNAERDQAVSFNLSPSKDIAQWSAPFVPTRSGQWVVRLRIESGKHVFAIEERVFLNLKQGN